MYRSHTYVRSSCPQGHAMLFSTSHIPIVHVLIPIVAVNGNKIENKFANYM